MDEVRLREILSGFANCRIAVVGDFFLDKWLLIDRDLDEPSLETGLTAYQVTGKRLCPGAAGTITNNLSALTVGEIYALGFIGEDGEGYELEHGLKSTGVNTEYLIKSNRLFTPTYTKPLFDYPSGSEETHRLDIRNRKPVPVDIEDKIIDNLHEIVDKVDAIIALDQVVEENTGVISGRVRECLENIGQSRPELIVYADSRAHIMDFSNIILKCNHLEVVHSVYPDYKGEPDEELIGTCMKRMSQRTGKQVFVTWGSKGIMVLKKDGFVRVPSIPVTGQTDICGAGDAATSGIVSALCCGASPEEAAIIGNLAASITIQQIGTTGTADQAGIIETYLRNT